MVRSAKMGRDRGGAAPLPAKNSGTEKGGWNALVRDRRIYTVFALMLAMFLTAVDVTIIDTAMPRIVGALGGFAMMTWLVTAYMLTSTAAMPVFGKVADLAGRKATFTIGAALFVLGSALCGLSQSMGQLILFRGLQGIGAGAVQPVVQTIIGDIFTPVERARMQAWFSGVWGFSALVGPLVGGLIVDFASWRWLFYINLPLGLLAILMIWLFLEEHPEPRPPVAVDYLGSITMTGGLSLLLLVLLTGGTQYPWGSPQILGMLLGAAVLLTIFFWQERRAADPMLPLSLFRDPVIALAMLASFMVGGVLTGMSVYLPIWAQGVEGFSATKSGLSLLWISVGWPIASILGGRLVVRQGVRPAALLGLALNVAGSMGLVALGRLTEAIPPVALAAVTFVIGSGMGYSTLAFVLGVQNAVTWARRGVATAALQFLRTLGGLVWVSAMGMTLNLSLLPRLREIPGVVARTAQEAGDLANQLLDPAAWRLLPAGQLASMRTALAEALRSVHLLVLLAALISLVVVLFMPNMRFQTGDQPGERST